MSAFVVTIFICTACFGSWTCPVDPRVISNSVDGCVSAVLVWNVLVDALSCSMLRVVPSIHGCAMKATDHNVSTCSKGKEAVRHYDP